MSQPYTRSSSTARQRRAGATAKSSNKQTIHVYTGISFPKSLFHATFRHANAPFAEHAESELQKHMNYASKPTSGLHITSNQLHTKISLESNRLAHLKALSDQKCENNAFVQHGPEATTC